MADDNKTPNATSTAKPAAAEPTKAAAPAEAKPAAKAPAKPRTVKAPTIRRPAVRRTAVKATAPAAKEPSLKEVSLDDPSLYINRDISWIEFDRKVLETAMDPEIPLLNRVLFLSIFYNNLDEFFMVRVMNVQRQARSGAEPTGPDKMPPAVSFPKFAVKSRRFSKRPRIFGLIRSNPSSKPKAFVSLNTLR